jgi:hypothetical protein
MTENVEKQYNSSTKTDVKQSTELADTSWNNYGTFQETLTEYLNMLYTEE